MDTAPRNRWLRTMILVGTVYVAVGVIFGALAGGAGSQQMRVTWRLAAWVASAVAFGAFALALVANIHDIGSGYRLRMLVALIAWPLLTAVPAFIVALVVAAGLGVKRVRG